jgi:hypothetical protein
MHSPLPLHPRVVELHVPVAVRRYDVGNLFAQRHLDKRRPVRWETSSLKRVATYNCHEAIKNHTENKKKTNLNYIYISFSFSRRWFGVFVCFGQGVPKKGAHSSPPITHTNNGKMKKHKRKKEKAANK